MNSTRLLTLATAILLTSVSLTAQDHPLDQYWSNQFGLPELPGDMGSIRYLENGDVLAIADSLWRWDGSTWSIVSLPVGDIVVEGMNLELSDLSSRSLLWRDRIYSITKVNGPVRNNQIIWASADGQGWYPYGDTLPPGDIFRLAFGPDGEGYVGYQRYDGGKYISDIYRYDGVTWEPFQTDLIGTIPWIGVAPDGTPIYTLYENPDVSISWQEADTIATLRFPSSIGVPSSLDFHGDSAYGFIGLPIPGEFAIASFNRSSRTVTIVDSLPSGTRFPSFGGDFARDGDVWVVTTRDGLIRGEQGNWVALGDEFVPGRLTTSDAGRILGYVGSSDSNLLLESIGIAELDLSGPEPTWRGLYDTSRAYFGLDGVPNGVVTPLGDIYAYGMELRGAGREGDAFGPILVNDWRGWQSIDGLHWTKNFRPVEVRQMIDTEGGIWTIGRFDSIPSGRTSGLAKFREGWTGTDTTSLFEEPVAMVVRGTFQDTVVVLGTRADSVTITVLALWDGEMWTLLDERQGVRFPTISEVPGVGLVIGGVIESTFPVPTEGIAAFAPSSGWRSLGGGLGLVEGRNQGHCGHRDFPWTVDMYVTLDNLYITGVFHRAGNVMSGGVARWNLEESSWERVGYGLAFTRWCIGGYAIGGLHRSVVVAGGFQQTDTTFPYTTDLGAGRIARYDTETDLWTPLGSGLESRFGTLNVVINDINTYQSEIFVVGNFDHAGGHPSRNIARYLMYEDDPIYTAPALPDTVSFGTLSRVQEAEQDIIITNPLTSTRTVELRLMRPKTPFVLSFVHDTGSVHPAGDTTVLRLAPGQSVTARIGVETEVSGTFRDLLRIESPQLEGYPRMIVLEAVRTAVSVEEERVREVMRLDLSVIDRE